MAFDMTAREAEQAREAAMMRHETRRFHIAMTATLIGVLVLIGVLTWLAMATEPQRRVAYLADCQARGFAAGPCEWLYADRRRRGANDTVATGLAVSAFAAAASRR